MGDVLLRSVGKVVDARCRGKGGHGADTHGVHDGLHRDFAKLHGGLLHGADPAVAHSLAQQLAVKHEPASAQLQYRNFPADVQGAEQAAHALAQHGGKGAALAAPVQGLHKKQIAADVQHGADHQKVQGTLAVAQGTQRGGQKIVKKGEEQARKHDAQVVHGNGQDLRRHLQQPQQGICQQDAQQREGQREHRTGNGSGGHLPFHQLRVSGTKGGADQNAGTQTDAVDEQDGQSHQRVGGAHGCQRILPHELAHDDAVGGIVGELEQIAQHQRDGKVDQQRRDLAAGHIFGHGGCEVLSDL